MPNSDYLCIGLDEIAIGDSRTGDGMPATLTTVSNIVPDSCVLAIEAPGKTELMVEDNDYPVAVINQSGEKVFEFATRDMHPTHFALAMGGDSGSTYWKSSASAVVVQEKAIRAKSKLINGKQLVVDCVHTNLRGGAQLRFSKTDSGSITYAADILRPNAANTDRAIYARLE